MSHEKPQAPSSKAEKVKALLLSSYPGKEKREATPSVAALEKDLTGLWQAVLFNAFFNDVSTSQSLMVQKKNLIVLLTRSPNKPRICSLVQS